MLKYLKNKTKKNKMLKIIKNKTTKNKIKYLEGPITFTYYKNLDGNRKLLLLGEDHTTPNSCKNKLNKIHITEYLEEIANNNIECVDIFIEQDYILKNNKFNFIDLLKTEYLKFKYGKYSNNMNKIRTKFRKCTVRNKTYCNYKNSRIHFTDPRTIWTNEKNMYNINYNQDKINNSRIIYPVLYISEFNSQVLENLDYINYVENSFSNVNFKDIIKFLIGWKRNDKNFHKFVELMALYGGQNITQLCYKWCQLYFKIIDKEKNKIKNYSVEKIYKILYEVYLEIYSNENNLFWTIFNIPMDVYFIFRYLMTYNKRRYSKICKNINYSKTSIIYCGDVHRFTYTLFFNKFFNTQADIFIDEHNYENYSESKSCIKLPTNFDIFN